MESALEEPHPDSVKEPEDSAEDNILKVDPDDFVYDEKNDTIQPKDQAAFDTLLEKHPSVNNLKRDNKRNQKVEKLKEKVLNTLKVIEKKKRDLSCESVRSGCSGWGPGGSSSERDLSADRGEIRQRSEDEEFKEDQPSKSLRRSRSLLQPPKIVISK